MNDHNEEIQNIITRTLNTRFETINIDKIFELVKLIYLHIAPTIKNFIAAVNDAPEGTYSNIARMDEIRKHISNTILGDISTFDIESQIFVIKLFSEYNVQMDKQNVNILFRKNNKKCSSDVTINIQNFYEILVDICIKNMDHTERMLQILDRYSNDLENEFNKLSDYDKPVTNLKEIENIVLYIKKITEPTAIAITKGFSTKIVILSQVMHTFYREMTKFTPLVKLNMEHNYNRYLVDYEQQAIAEKRFIEHYEGINIYLDLERMGKLRSVNVAITVSSLFGAKLIILASQGFQYYCTNEHIRHWIYAHELGHVLHGTDIASRKVIIRYSNMNKKRPNVLFSRTKREHEYLADKFAYRKYGEVVSVDALKWLGEIKSTLCNKSLSEIMNDNSSNTHPSLNERIAKIKSYKKKIDNGSMTNNSV